MNYEIINQLQDLKQVIALSALLQDSKTEYMRTKITNKLAVVAFPDEWKEVSDDHDLTALFESEVE